MAQIVEKEFLTQTVNITLVTTAEIVVITCPPVKIPLATCRVLVKAWALLTTGATTASVTPRIRRGTLVTDPLVGEQSAVTVPTAAGGTDEFATAVSEQLQNQESVQYILTLQQNGASANGTALTASIEVEVLNG